jgi:prepilin peptidase CpaA
VTLATPWAALFVAGMLAAAASDLARRRIPNALSVGLLGAGLLGQVAGGGPTALLLGLAGAGLGLALLLPLFQAGWLGGGDVKLVTAAGAWLGPAATLWATLAGLAGGGVISLGVLAAGGAALRAEVATNLKNAALGLTLPTAPRRRASQLVPVALALAGACLGFFVAGGAP